MIFTSLIVAMCRINPLNAELNPICYLLALLEAHPILHVSRIRVKPRKIKWQNSMRLKKRNF
jgi:hypothetical protein